MASPTAATPTPSLSTLLITTRSPNPSAYLPPVADALKERKVVSAVLGHRECKDLKSALTALARGLMESTSKFLGTASADGAANDDEDEEAGEGVYLQVKKKAKGEARIPEWDAGWIAAWWIELNKACRKKGVDGGPRFPRPLWP